MLHYPEAWWVAAIRDLSRRAFELRGLVHRIAGVVMLAAGAWHIAYLAFTAAGRSLFRDLLPRARDLTDPWAVLKYNLGLAPEKPQFGRFSYIEKAEYWALVWGTILMGADRRGPLVRQHLDGPPDQARLGHLAHGSTSTRRSWRRWRSSSGTSTSSSSTPTSTR